MEYEQVSGTLPIRIPAQVPPPIRAATEPLTPGERANLASRVLAGLRMLPVAGCSWCGGSGTWIDPETGEAWPCIQCRYGRDGSDNHFVSHGC